MQASSQIGSQTGSQIPSKANSQDVTDVLHQMSDRADVIFMVRCWRCGVLTQAAWGPAWSRLISRRSGHSQLHGRDDLYAAGVGRSLGGWRPALPRRTALLMSVACAECRWDEFAGGWARRSYSDSPGLHRDSAGDGTRRPLRHLRRPSSICAGLGSKCSGLSRIALYLRERRTRSGRRQRHSSRLRTRRCPG